MKPLPNSAAVLSMVAFAAAGLASISTLIWPGTFPDPSPSSLSNRVLAEAQGWSASTLLIALPIAIASLVAARRGALRGRLIWLGTLAYFVYTYLEFAVIPPFTALYLVYIAAFACALSAFIIGLSTIELATLPAAFGPRAPKRTIAVVSLVFSLLLATTWLKAIIGQTLAGAFGWPSGEAAVGHVVHALDLGLQVPLGIATGILLLRRRPVGLLLASIMLTNVVCMGAVLTAMVLWASADAGTSAWLAAPFAIFWLIGVAIAIWLFRSGVPALPREPFVP